MSLAVGAPGSLSTWVAPALGSCAQPSARSRGLWDLINYRSCSSFARLFDRLVCPPQRVFPSLVPSFVRSFSPESPPHWFVLSLELRCVAPPARPSSARRRNEFLRQSSAFAVRDSFKQINVITSTTCSCIASITGAVFVVGSRIDLWIVQIRFPSIRCSTRP